MAIMTTITATTPPPKRLARSLTYSTACMIHSRNSSSRSSLLLSLRRSTRHEGMVAPWFWVLVSIDDSTFQFVPGQEVAARQKAQFGQNADARHNGPLVFQALDTSPPRSPRWPKRHPRPIPFAPVRWHRCVFLKPFRRIRARKHGAAWPPVTYPACVPAQNRIPIRVLWASRTQIHGPLCRRRGPLQRLQRARAWLGSRPIKPAGSLSSGVMSLYKIPSCGKLGISRIRFFMFILHIIFYES